MQRSASSSACALALGFAAACVFAAPSSVLAQTVGGQARAVQATIVYPAGSETSILADTGTLGATDDARNASATSGVVPSLLTSGVMHAATVGGPEQVTSEASVADLNITIAGLAVRAEFAMARTRATLNGKPAPSTEIRGLTIDGVPVDVSGEANQTVPLGIGRIVINEQQTSAGTSAVTALRVVVDGMADVVVAAASASVTR
jgi:hypothetical protein